MSSDYRGEFEALRKVPIRINYFQICCHSMHS